MKLIQVIISLFMKVFSDRTCLRQFTSLRRRTAKEHRSTSTHSEGKSSWWSMLRQSETFRFSLIALHWKLLSICCNLSDEVWRTARTGSWLSCRNELRPRVSPSLLFLATRWHRVGGSGWQWWWTNVCDKIYRSNCLSLAKCPPSYIFPVLNISLLLNNFFSLFFLPVWRSGARLCPGGGDLGKREVWSILELHG